MLLLWDHGTGASHVRGVVEQPHFVGRRAPETVVRTLMAIASRFLSLVVLYSYLVRFC